MISIMATKKGLVQIMKTEQKKSEKDKPKYGMWSNTCYMLKLAWQVQKSVIWLCVISAALAVISNLLNLYITPSVLRLVETAAPLSKLLAAILLFSGALMLVGALGAYVNTNTLFGRITVRSEIVSMIHDKYATTSYPNTEDQGFLRKARKASDAAISNEAAAEGVWDTFKVILEHVTGFLIYLILLSSVNWVVLAATLITSVIGYFVNQKINGWEYRHREESAAYSNKISYVIGRAKDRTFAKDIRIFGMGPWLEDIYNSTMRLYRAFWIKREKVRFLGNFADAVLAFLRNGIAYAYLIGLVLKNGLSASEFLLYFSAIGGFTSWVTGILSDFSVLYKQSLDLSTVREYLEIEEKFRFTEGETLNLPYGAPCEIELRHLTFRYPEAKEPILKDINLIIHPGEKLAIVGLNGAGKTTLVKLICGFYDPNEGEVLLNGTDIRRYNRFDYYRHISAIFQQFSVLAASIAENVAQSRDHIDRDRMRKCIEKAGLTEKIESLPNQYETKLGREVYEDALELSGGEMQRLMLARTIYKDAPVMVLDEPTAALDPIAESDMYQRYNELTEGRTSVYISHRLASTRFCDRIILLENGIIKEEGTHEQLIAQNGSYADLFEIQSRYYQEGGNDNEQ